MKFVKNQNIDYMIVLYIKLPLKMGQTLYIYVLSCIDTHISISELDNLKAAEVVDMK